MRIEETNIVMTKALICIPSELPGGLEARLSKSFEDSDVYNFIEIDRDANPAGISLAFQRYSCHASACLDPVEAITKKGAIAVIVKSISSDYLLRFLGSPVRVLLSNEENVLASARGYVADRLREMTWKDFSAIDRT